MEKPIVKTEIQETRDLAERELQMSQERKCNRRRFLGIAAMSIAAAQLGMIGSADAQSSKQNRQMYPRSSRERTRRSAH